MADFFTNFPTINYPLSGYASDVCNILVSILPQRLNVDKAFVFQKYQVKGGKPAMAVAYELYSDATLDWTLYLVNNLVNPYIDWPMTDETLYSYAQTKYDADPYTTVHHFEYASNGRYLDDVDDAYFRTHPVQGGIVPVTIWDYESQLNLAKSNIIVINPRYITTFTDSFKKALLGQAQ